MKAEHGQQEEARIQGKGSSGLQELRYPSWVGDANWEDNKEGQRQLCGPPVDP